MNTKPTSGATRRPRAPDSNDRRRALMWTAERDPLLRSSFLNVTFLDRPADLERFRDRIALAVEHIPRLRQRVRPAAGPGWRRRWIDDAELRPRLPRPPRRPPVARHRPPAARRRRARMSRTPFDRDRPLWQFTIVEGLNGGRGALLAKMHHTISDGVGAIRLSAMFTDIERDAAEPLVTGGSNDRPKHRADPFRTARNLIQAADPRTALGHGPLSHASTGRDPEGSLPDLARTSLPEPALRDHDRRPRSSPPRIEGPGRQHQRRLRDDRCRRCRRLSPCPQRASHRTADHHAGEHTRRPQRWRQLVRPHPGARTDG